MNKPFQKLDFDLKSLLSGKHANVGIDCFTSFAMTVKTGYLGLDKAWLAATPPTKPHPIENKQNHRHYERSEVISYFNRTPMI